MQEFSDLRGVIYSAFDNVAVLTCESLFALLEYEGCEVYKKLSSKEFIYPSFAELKSDIEKIQVVKKSFIRRFWKLSGRQAVRAISVVRLAEVSTIFLLLLIYS